MEGELNGRLPLLPPSHTRSSVNPPGCVPYFPEGQPGYTGSCEVMRSEIFISGLLRAQFHFQIVQGACHGTAPIPLLHLGMWRWMLLRWHR